MGKKEEILKDFTEKFKIQDIKKISSNLNNMCRGAVKKIWPKVQALYAMVKDPQVSWKSKALAAGTLLYLISPLDAVPDFLPGIGLNDDVALILTTVAVLGHELKKYLVKTVEEMADIEVKKHNKKLRITLITMIICALLAVLVKLLLGELG